MQGRMFGGNALLGSEIRASDYTRRFAQVTQAVERLKPSTLHLDGKLVAMAKAAGMDTNVFGSVVTLVEPTLKRRARRLKR
jgi:hypothetical protein